MRLFARLVVTLCCLPLSPSSGLADTELATRVSDVTVFSDRAIVARAGEADLPAGETTLPVANLPDDLIDNSLQVHVEGTPGLTLLSTDLRREVLTGAANPQARSLEDQIRKLEQQKADLAFQTTQLKQRESYLVTLTTAFAKAQKTAAMLPDLESVYRFYVEETSKLGATQQDLQRQVQAVTVQLDRAKAELEQLNRSRAQRKLLIGLRAEQPARARVRLEYQVTNASWQPVYHARVRDDENRLVLDYSGSVRQRTGEDWLGAILTLSTAQPGRSGRMPDFQPVYLRFLEPRPLAESNAEVAPKTRAMAIAPAPASAAPAAQSSAEVISRGLSVSYRAPLPANVPSDGEAHEVSLQQIALEGKPVYVTTPALDQVAFLRYHLTNRSDALLLAGNVNLYRDGDLVGTSSLSDVASGAEFDLDFGRDQNLAVRRKLMVDRRSSSGLINRKDARERKVEIILENHHAAPVRVRLYDGLPVSQNAEITVSGVSFSEAPTAHDQETGKLTWEFDLAAQAKKVIEFGFTVQWPQGKEIVEGN